MRCIHRSWGNGPRKWLSCYPPYLRSCGIDRTFSKLVNNTKLCGAPTQGIFERFEKWVCVSLTKFNKVSWFQPRTERIFHSSHHGADPGAVWACLCSYSRPFKSLPKHRDKGFSLPRRRWAWPHMEETACGGSSAILLVFQGSKQQMKWWGNTDPNWREFPPLVFIVLGFGKKNVCAEGIGAILFFVLGSRVDMLGWSVSEYFLYVNHPLFYTFVINIVAVTINFLMSLLYPVNSSNLSLQSLLFVSLRRGAGMRGAAGWGFTSSWI